MTEEDLEELVRGYCQIHYFNGKLQFCWNGNQVSNVLIANSACCVTFCAGGYSDERGTY